MKHTVVRIALFALELLATVGAWIPMSGRVSEETAFRVRDFETNRWMLWEKAASTWAWQLVPVDEEHTRLLIRLRCRYRWSRPTIVTDLVLMEIGDFPMMRKLMLGIKRRAEHSSEQAREAVAAMAGAWAACDAMTRR